MPMGIARLIAARALVLAALALIGLVLGCHGDDPCGPAERPCKADGRCVDAACDGVLCASGQRCIGGSCVSLSDGVVCPDLMVCASGACITVMQVDPGPPPIPDAVMIMRYDGGRAEVDGGVDAGRRGPPASPGCACRATACSGASYAWLAALALVLWRSRRR